MRRYRKGIGYLSEEQCRDFIVAHGLNSDLTSSQIWEGLDGQRSTSGRRKIPQPTIEIIQEAMWFLYVHTDTPSTTIARAASRTHPTVIKAAKKIEDLIGLNPKFVDKAKMDKLLGRFELSKYRS